MHDRLPKRIMSALLFATLLIVLAVPVPPVQAQNSSDKAVTDWRVTTVKRDVPVSVAYTADTQESGVELHIGKFKDQCNTSRMYVFVKLNAPATKDFEQTDTAGEIRIDQLPAHKTVTRVYYKKGWTSVSYYVHSFENPQSVIKELTDGQVVTFRFKASDQERTYRFSLKGFGPSYQRIAQMCSQPAAPAKPAQPKPEGGTKPGGKSDADFFGSGKSDGKTPKNDKDYF
ncbi:MAG: hypothetical protein FD177_2057 [Desulfovibrionaceae bacterium]|nr:MAG: hypothetical protein FD177_2057 [Desulfovibrionaceae bacterium]